MEESMKDDQQYCMSLKRKKLRQAENSSNILSNSIKTKRHKYSESCRVSTSSDSTNCSGSDSMNNYLAQHSSFLEQRHNTFQYDQGKRQVENVIPTKRAIDDTDFARFVSSNEVDHVLSPVIWQSFQKRDYDSLMNRFGIDEFHRDGFPRSSQNYHLINDYKVNSNAKIDPTETLAQLESEGDAPESSTTSERSEDKCTGDEYLGSPLPTLSSFQNCDRTLSSIPEKFYIALDCEMVGVGPKGSRSALARCSIVDYDGNVLYDRYIRPNEPITDYRTRWSGVTFHHMQRADPEDVALVDIYRFIENRIVIGHAVYNDFGVLRKFPPCYMVRDTAQCKLLVKMAGLEGQGNSLKRLSLSLLDKAIQTKRKGHDSVEDAIATLELFKLVRSEWEPELFAKWQKKGIDIGQSLTSMEDIERKGHNDVDYLSDKYWPYDLLI